MTTKVKYEYRLASYNSAKRRWEIKADWFNCLKDAQHDLAFASDPKTHGYLWPTRWKIVRRQMVPWETVEIKEENIGKKSDDWMFEHCRYGDYFGDYSMRLCNRRGGSECKGKCKGCKMFKKVDNCKV